MSEHDRGDARGTGAVPLQHHAPMPVSRRTLVKTAVGAGVAVAIAGTVGIANAGTTASHQSTGSPLTAGGAALSTNSAAHVNGPVVVQVVNAHTGTLEVFSAGERKSVHDADLAARIGRVSSAGPVVVHVVDAGTGALDVFSNGSSRQISNADLANRIVQAV
jgi:hypothetical protein